MTTRGPYRGLGIDWNLKLHTGQVNNRGEIVIHETAIRCPCGADDMPAGLLERPHVLRKRTTFRCELCNGIGFLFRDPRKVVAILTGISETRNRDEMGWMVPGDAIMSIAPGYQVCTGDRITYTWPQAVDEGQVIVRGAGSQDENGTRKNIGVDDDEDLLWYNAAESVWCEDLDGKVYEGGADFELDGSRVVRWKGNRPQMFKPYTLKYMAYLEWIVFNPPNTRQDRGRDLGMRCPLRKRHIVLPTKDPSIRALDRVAFCTRLGGC